jgi:hypothetical protein
LGERYDKEKLNKMKPPSFIVDEDKLTKRSKK